MRLFLLVWLLLVIIYLNGIAIKEFFNTKNSQEIKCIPDSGLFKFKKIGSTLNPEDTLLIRGLPIVKICQYIYWVFPYLKSMGYNPVYNISNKDLELFKLVSFQRKTDIYCSIILITRGIEPILDDEQHLITIDHNTGKYIDGLTVAALRNASNSDIIMDTLSQTMVLSRVIRSKFKEDTIKLYELRNVYALEETDPTKAEWQELYETIYLIQPDGRIAILREQRKIKDSRDRK